MENVVKMLQETNSLCYRKVYYRKPTVSYATERRATGNQRSPMLQKGVLQETNGFLCYREACHRKPTVYATERRATGDQQFPMLQRGVPQANSLCYKYVGLILTIF